MVSGTAPASLQRAGLVQNQQLLNAIGEKSIAATVDNRAARWPLNKSTAPKTMNNIDFRAISRIALLFCCALSAGIICPLTAPRAWADDTGISKGDTSKFGIALSNSYAGNTWRQEMLKTWDIASKDAIDHHIIAKTKVVNSNNSAPEQASQIENLIVEGWKAIVIDAASDTALNGVIKEATDAGIVVVVFDALATAPSAYKVAYNYVSMGQQESDYVAKRLNGKGNVLEIRGVAGTSVDNDISKGIQDGFTKYPDIKIVGSVHGNWTQTIAQKEVAGILPTLPPVDAIVTQGGDGWGAYEAFKEAGRKIPLIIMGAPSGRASALETTFSGTRWIRNLLDFFGSWLRFCRILGCATDSCGQESAHDDRVAASCHRKIGFGCLAESASSWRRRNSGFWTAMDSRSNRRQRRA